MTRPATFEAGRDLALLTVAEVADILRCSEWSVYARIDKGELRSVLVGRLLRVPHAALEDYVAGGGTPKAVAS